MLFGNRLDRPPPVGNLPSLPIFTCASAAGQPVYYGDPVRDAAMDSLYQKYLKTGDVAFDIGSHVGDRIASFRRIGAKVVALEPQPDCAQVIRIIHGADAGVHLMEQACGARAGKLMLHINSQNPTVTTASADFITAAKGAEGWKEQVWDREIEVRVTTLDRLIANHGVPAFAKIDVEGFEDQVIEGLSTPVPVLSFEFTTIQRGLALKCLERLRTLGRYRFDIALGESQQLTFGTPVATSEMITHIASLPHNANSGDIYAILTP